MYISTPYLKIKMNNLLQRNKKYSDTKRFFYLFHSTVSQIGINVIKLQIINYKDSTTDINTLKKIINFSTNKMFKSFEIRPNFIGSMAY